MVFKWFFNGFLNGRILVPLIVGSLTSKRRHDGQYENNLKIPFKNH